jgi:hypothetical protein
MPTDLLALLRCLQKYKGEPAPTEEVFQCSKLSEPDFIETKQHLIEKDFIKESHGYLVLNEKGTSALEKLNKALFNFKDTLARSRKKSKD